MYFREALRTPGVLNIFTDASVDSYRKISSPGFIAVTTINGIDEIVDMQTTILQDSTNNNGEIRAISMALYYAAVNKDKYKYINLFADSQLCINTLREWIYNWMRIPHLDYKTKEKILCNSEGKPVANQSEILGCLRTIIHNSLNICLYHVKGHVTGTSNSINKAYETFVRSNYFSPDSISIDDITYLAEYNNIIDSVTTDTLVNYQETTEQQEKVIRNILYSGIDMKKYGQLTNSSMLKKKAP